MSYKNIFFFWEGAGMSFMRYMTLYSFRKFHPDWNITLINGRTRWDSSSWHSEERQDFLSYNSEDYFGRCKDIGVKMEEFDTEYGTILDTLKGDSKLISPVHKKDILNWYLLSQKNGIVADMDILFIRNMDKEYEEFYNSGAEMGITCFNNHPRPNYIPISLVMGKKSDFALSIFEKSLKEYNPHIYESCGALLLSHDLGSKINDSTHTQFFKLKDELIFPFTSKMPYSLALENQYDSNIQCMVNEENTSAIHWYGGHNKSQTFNNTINHTNYKEFSGTLAHFLKEIYNA
jgi:hypothetical protein